MPKPIIDCYVRNSTALQVDNWRAEYQKTELPRIVRDLGYDPQVWEEQGQSGETLDARKKMQAILARVAARTSLGIATVDFGRLSRDVDMLDGLKIWEVCKRVGAIIVTPGKVWHPGTDQDDDFAFITFWYESRNKRDLVRKMSDGLVTRAAATPMYTGHCMYGYTAERVEERRKNGRISTSVAWHVHPDEAEVIREICQMYLTKGTVEIAHDLNDRAKTDPKYAWRIVEALQRRRSTGSTAKPTTESQWRPQVIQRILQQPLYRGIKPVFKIRRTLNTQRAPIKTHDVPDLQIIPDDLARAVDTVRSSRKFGTGGRVEPTSPYAKLLRCPHCGAWLTFHCHSPGPDEKRNDLRHYYDCSQRLEYGKQRCPGCRLSAEAIHAALVPLVKAQLDALADAELEARAAALLAGTDEQVRALKAEVDALKTAIADYTRDYYVTKKLPIPEAIFLETMATWSAQLAEKQKRLRDLSERKRVDTSPDVLALLATLKSDLGEILASEPPTVQNTILHALFREVTIDRGEGMLPRGTGYRFPAKVVAYEAVWDNSIVDAHSSKTMRESIT
jgi:hypothetical protein